MKRTIRAAEAPSNSSESTFSALEPAYSALATISSEWSRDKRWKKPVQKDSSIAEVRRRDSLGANRPGSVSMHTS